MCYYIFGDNMNIKTLKVGSLETNCYIISFNDKCLIVDPGDDASKILELVGSLKVVGIIITHYHFDHIGALEEIQSVLKCDVYGCKNLKIGKNNIDGIEFDVLFTPGHKEDAICIYFENEKVLFSGDFIFQGTIGRMDLPGGNVLDMKKSILSILDYPDDTLIYPGHGEVTLLKHEKEDLKHFVNYF